MYSPQAPQTIRKNKKLRLPIWGVSPTTHFTRSPHARVQFTSTAYPDANLEAVDYPLTLQHEMPLVGIQERQCEVQVPVRRAGHSQ